MGLLNVLMFDDISSQTYGFYIDGQATFDAPARRGETVMVPGRNGTLFLDDGTFENIEVEYNVFYDGKNDGRFRDRLAQFRAALMSKRGYLRLTDTYHPEEFRLARYKADFKVEPIMYNRAGSFKLLFDCKPQRYLKVGEREYENPFNIKNETNFPASPLIKIYGYGDLDLNDKRITVEDNTLGKIIFLGIAQNDSAETLYSPFTKTTFNTGDYAETDATWYATFTVSNATPGTISVDTDNSTLDYGLIIAGVEIAQNGQITIKMQWPDINFQAGIAASWTKTAQIRVDYTNSQTSQPTYTTVGISETVDILTTGVQLSSVTVTNATKVRERKIIDTGTVNSSVSTLGNPLYIDCESGEAYKYDEDGEMVNVNSGVWLGENLPVLEPGVTTWFMHDNETMPRFIIVPRWWTL